MLTLRESQDFVAHSLPGAEQEFRHFLEPFP